jgi:hypothetical protein
MALGLGKTSAIFGTGVGILDILLSRGRGSNLPDDHSPTTPGSQERTTARHSAFDPHHGIPADPNQTSGRQGTMDGRKPRFSLNQFTSRIHKKEGLFQANRYAVRIFPKDPTQAWWKRIFKEAGGSIEDLTFLCNSASLPGVQIITSDHRRQNMGTFDRRPFGVQVTDIPLTFMLDNQGFILELFNSWTNTIVNYGKDIRAEDDRDTDHNKALFEVNYRDDYLCKVEIHTYDQTTKQINVYHLNEAFPMQVGDVTAAWSETDQFGVLPVQFTFRTYEIERKKIVVKGALETGIPEDIKIIPAKRKKERVPIHYGRKVFENQLAGKSQDPGPYENPSMAGFGKHGR